jgi:hypothetical protein
MSSIADKDKYVVYDGTEHEMASFILFDRDHDGDEDRPRLVGGMRMDPDDVPEGIEYMDHFWVELDDDREITALEPAPEMHEQRKDDYQAAVDIFKERQECQKRKWGEADGE